MTHTLFGRRHESPELGAMVARMMNALIRRAAEGDTEAVEQLGYLEKLARQASASAQAEARRFGYSLAELAKVTGTTRQAVSQRTAAPVSMSTAGCEHHGCVGVQRCRVPGVTVTVASQSRVSTADLTPCDTQTDPPTPN